MAAREVILSPSLLSADFGKLHEELAALADAGLQWVHLDVMDGRFVPNITYGPPVIKAIRERSKLFFDCHLMIEEPGKWVEAFADAGADLICIHAEAEPHLERAVARIRELGCQAAVALNPHTPLDVVRWLLPELDMVLIMSVNPGFGGQKFIPFSLEKLRELRAMCEACGSEARIQVDGGVSPENCADIVDAGADVLVSGSAFFNHPPYAERLDAFRNAWTAAR